MKIPTKRPSTTLRVTGLVLTFLALSGCQNGMNKTASGLDRLNPFAVAAEKEAQPARSDSMVAIWKPSVYEKAGEPSVRGFGGRFYFYNARNEPVRVAGELTIYGYDDAKDATRQSGEADRKFVFESESLESHYSDSGLGASYSFWVPWEPVGGEERTITLIPVFKSADGSVPQSKPATMRLPGKRVKSKQAFATHGTSSAGDIALATHTDASKGTYVTQAGGLPATTDDGQTRRSPTTLRLTRSLSERIAKADPQQQRGTRELVEAMQKRSPVELNSQETKESFTKAIETAKPKTKDPVRSASNVFGQPGSFR